MLTKWEKDSAQDTRWRWRGNPPLETAVSLTFLLCWSSLASSSLSFQVSPSLCLTINRKKRVMICRLLCWRNVNSKMNANNSLSVPIHNNYHLVHIFISDFYYLIAFKTKIQVFHTDSFWSKVNPSSFRRWCFYFCPCTLWGWQHNGFVLGWCSLLGSHLKLKGAWRGHWRRARRGCLG